MEGLISARGTCALEQNKSFTQFFQKIADSKGRAFGRTPQRAKPA